MDFRWRGVVGRICPAQEHAPRRRSPDTARRRKNLPHARRLSSAKASRHGARAKEFAPREKALLGEGLPTRRTSERICAAQEHAPRRRPPDTAHERRDLPPRENALLGESLPTRRTSERICPHENALLGEGLPTRRTSERICPAGFALAPRADERRAALGPQTAEKHPFGGVAPTARGRCRVHSPKKIRLLHETQLFYGESHVGSRQIFPSFPSVGRCAARERNPVPPVAPHRGSEHRGLRRTGEMVRRFDAMCPRGGEWLPRGGRCGPSFRCFGERFHRLCRANPDACRGRRCSRAHDDLGQRAFRCSRPTFRHRRRSDEKTFGG